MNESTDKQNEQKTVVDQLQEQLADWQTKVEEARVQMNLGAKEAEEAMQPHLDNLEKQLFEAKKQWEQMESASTSAWEDVHDGLTKSMDAMQVAFENATKHFTEKKDK